MTAACIESVALEEMIKAQAYGLGFDLVGITTLGPMETAAAFDDWIGRGYAGQMHYLPRGAEKRRDSRLPVPGTASAIVVALDYGGAEPPGSIARYARGDDYHDVMTARLDELHRWLEVELGREVVGKSYVDTGPLLERDLARRAGLGWFGKNTNIVNPKLGSFFFLGTLLVDVSLTADAPFEADRCGSCTRCLDACPTDAFVEPRMLDATRCISYLTIENRESIPRELRRSIGGRVYGCDTCQDVCPWNVRFGRELKDPAFRPRETSEANSPRDVARDILALDETQFRARYSGSPMKRAKRSGLARNAAVVLGNAGDGSDLPALRRALAHDEPLVREHAAWAIAEITARS